MKSILAVCCLFLVAGVARSGKMEEFDAVFAEDINACSEELQIPASTMSKIHDPELSDDEKATVGCLKACVMKRLNALADGQIKTDNFQETLEKMFADTPEVIPSKKEILLKCVDEVKEKADECELAYEFTHCVMLNDKE